MNPPKNSASVVHCGNPGWIGSVWQLILARGLLHNLSWAVWLRPTPLSMHRLEKGGRGTHPPPFSAICPSSVATREMSLSAENLCFAKKAWLPYFPKFFIRYNVIKMLSHFKRYLKINLDMSMIMILKLSQE